MDQRIESFLGDVLALAGEDPDAVRVGVRDALAKCEAIFRLQEPKKRMRDQAAHACRALRRARIAEELQRRRGTRIGDLEAGAQRDRAGALSLPERRFPPLPEDPLGVARVLARNKLPVP
jgi:hypothetical protein